MKNLPKSLKPEELTGKDREDFVLRELEAETTKTIEKLDEINDLVAEEAAGAQHWAPLEELLLEKFKKIVAKENDFFKVAHIDKLKLEYEILIFLGKKNIGKTTEIYRMIGETLKRGKKFIYIRYSRNELDKAREGFNTDSISPVQMIQDKGVGKFYDVALIREKLRELEEDPYKIVNQQFIKKHSIPFVGYAYEFTFCQSYTGSQYEDFELVFYDECLTYDPRNTLRDTHLNNGAAFLSSIARNKKNLKVFLFGNLQGTNNAILDFYGIKRDDKFRYIARGGKDDGCRVLFINGGALYKGFEAQTRAARHAGGSYATKLMANEYLVTSTQLIEPKVFSVFEHYAHFLHEEALITIKRLGLNGGGLGAIKVSEYEGFEAFNYPIYTSNRLHLLKFSKVKFIGSIAHLLEKVCFSVGYKKARFYDEASLDYCSQLILDNPLEDDTFKVFI